jgi:cupin 2 domain-containing protein
MNLLANLPQHLPEELTTVLQRGENVRIERIISTGHCSPDGFWYDQPENEWVIVLQGAAQLELEDRVVELRAGDAINIPAHTKHRVKWTSPDEPTVWLAVFYW